MADLMKVLSEPRRREILRIVWSRELEAGEIHRAIAVVSFGAISQHLRILREAGAVRMRRDGRNRLYRADRAAVGPLKAYLERMWSEALFDLKSLAEAEEKKKR